MGQLCFFSRIPFRRDRVKLVVTLRTRDQLPAPFSANAARPARRGRAVSHGCAHRTRNTTASGCVESADAGSGNINRNSNGSAGGCCCCCWRAAAAAAGHSKSRGQPPHQQE